MRMRCLLPLALALVALLWLGGCGSGGDEFTGGARQGPFTFGIAFVPTGAGEILVIGFKNVTTDPARVYVNAYDSAGANYGAANQMYIVPGRGELQVPLSQIAGGPTNGGWICIDTRDVSNPDAVTGEPTPLATSGFVFPYAHRQLTSGGAEEDATAAVTGRASGVSIPFTPHTDRIQLMNYSFDQGAGAVTPLAITYAISTFDTDGDPIGTTVNQLVAANGAFDWTPPVGAGQVRVEPVGGPFPAITQIRYALTARENGLQTHVESRYTEASIAHWGGLLDVGFEVAFGQDSDGNVHDFALLLSNPTGATESITLQAVYRKGGVPVLTQPRGYVLGGGRTVYMRTTTRDSLGLQQGEDSWFEDIFGDVLASSGFDEVTLYVQGPPTIDISARHYDPAFSGFYHVLRAVPRSNRACVFGVPIQVTTSGGIRNYISITNTTNGDLEVPIRAFTPLLGTEYILDPVTVPARSRLDWSPDGLLIREEPTDTIGPPVQSIRLDFVPVTGALFRGRTESREPNQILRFVSALPIRD